MALKNVLVLHSVFAWPHDGDKAGAHAKKGDVFVEGTPEYEHVRRNHPEKAVRSQHNFPDDETPAEAQEELA